MPMDKAPEAAITSHAHLYKYKEKHQLSQHERRQQILNEQKYKRHIEADKNRELYGKYLEELEESDVEDLKQVDECDIEDFKHTDESVQHLEKSEQEEPDEYEEMEYVQSEVQYRRPESTKFKLMLTEWFIDIPDDLEENWLCKFAPEGFRVLLLAYKRRTLFFTIKSRYLFKLKTHFPGGGGINATGVTVLDCIFNKRNKTFFVLDCLYWSAMYTLDSEANFRFYWLKTKFYEMPELYKSVSKKYTFHLIEAIPLERSLLQEKIFQVLKLEEKEILYDGIVCYHSCGFYTFSYSPLATWLYCYMLPEKLGIDVPEVYLAKKPKGYINFQQYIESKMSARERYNKKKSHVRLNKNGDLDVSSVNNTEKSKNNSSEVNKYNTEMDSYAINTSDNDVMES
ncbi:snurportin-1 [Diorhabda sublineata]|uniref:snurportin-1 n=1 Tax=Diorhabda sublineata TaxID=1163346 RepID=UPI0024E10D4C|nr:snurportin-1 [Diorhabda sublineata]